MKLNVVNVLDNDTPTAIDTFGFIDLDPTTGFPNGGWIPGSTFGTPVTAADYQTPRSFLITIGLEY
ncbi:MAG: hypothetical protein HC882_05915 [Acidobacteria bacterium]|nr:hypothetical protein [Acidobacteriota bacterium]